MTTPFLQSQLDAAPRGAEPRWLADARGAARRDVAAGGLPSQRVEQWRYTSLKALEKRAFAPDADAATRAVDVAVLALPIDAVRAVFVNGVFRADLSTLDVLEGVTVEPLASAVARGDAALRDSLASAPSGPADAFAQLNAALAADGLVVTVAAGVRVGKPLHVVHAGAPAATAAAWHLRHVVRLGERAALTLVEHYAAAGTHDAFGTVVLRAALDAGAELAHVRLNDESDAATLVARTDATLAADATLRAWSLDLGCALARHDLTVALAGPRARLASRGVFASRGRQHVDTRLVVDHAARDTSSDLVWRGVADQRARGVFHGSILVQKGADGTDAALSNKNLLLSPHAEIDTQPALEIHADEVKASHGATVGQLDERALFYLRSRGVPPEEARSMLTFAFCRAVVDDVPLPPLREHLAALLVGHLPRLASVEDEAP